MHVQTERQTSESELEEDLKHDITVVNQEKYQLKVGAEEEGSIEPEATALDSGRYLFIGA